jgi:RNA polymerase sigma-70 factor, ECF subfamily
MLKSNKREVLKELRRYPRVPERLVSCEVTTAIDQDLIETYRSYASGLFRYALYLAKRRETAEDLLQEAFLRYFQTLKAGEQIQNRQSWLYRVVRNCFLALKERDEDSRSDILDPNLADRRGSPGPSYDRVQMLRQLIRSLSPRESECVRLRAEGLSYAEISAVLGIRSGTVGALLTRAVEKCQRLLGKSGE